MRRNNVRKFSYYLTENMLHILHKRPNGSNVRGNHDNHKCIVSKNRAIVMLKEMVQMVTTVPLRVKQIVYCNSKHLFVLSRSCEPNRLNN